MLHYRLLFLNKKTFTIAAAGALILLPVSMILMVLAASPQLTIFTVVSTLLNFLLCAGLIFAWKKEDIIRISGLVAGILLVELCHYAYLSELYISIGVDTIVSMGLIRCMMLSSYLMICFIILMSTYNHFTIFLGRKSGRTKLIANQISICVLLFCFLILTVENWLVDDSLLRQAAGAAGCLSDLCLFTVIACCELYLTVDGGALSAERRK